jgi:hypothetical protein
MPGNVGPCVPNSEQLYQEGVPDPIRLKPPFSAVLKKDVCGFVENHITFNIFCNIFA